MPPVRPPSSQSLRKFGSSRRIALAMLAALASATCDATSVLGPSGVENIALTFVGDSSVIVGGRLAPRVDVRIDGVSLAEPRIRYLSSDSTILAPTAAGDSLIARRVGSAVITAVLESSILPKHPPAVAQRMEVRVAGLIADRSQLELRSLGDTGTIGVTAVDINGQPVAGIPVVWVSSDTTVGVINARGRVTARKNGTATLYGIVGTDTAITALRVIQGVYRIAFEPTFIRIDALGATVAIQARGLDRNDSLVVGLPTEWTIDDPTVAGIDMNGTIVSRRNGTTWVRAESGGRQDSLRVVVDQRAVLVVISAPAGLDIPAVGDQLQLIALGFDRMSKDVTDGRPVWYSLDPAVAQVDPEWGYVRGLSASVARIVASQDGAEDTVVVRVSNIPVSLTVLPAVASMASVGDTLPLQVAVRNTRGDIVGASVVWHTPDVNIARVTDAGRVISLAPGTARVVASAAGLADTAIITVTNVPSSIDIVPTGVTLFFLGDTTSPEIIVRNGRGDQLSRDMVTWSTDAPSIATVSSAGRITAQGAGVTFVRASAGAARDSVRVSVNNDPQSIVLSVTRDTLTAPGQQLTVASVVRNASGMVLNGYATTWTTTNASVATVSSAGLVTSGGFGTALIIGQAGPAADTAVIVVRNQTLLHVDNASTISPAFGTRARPFIRIRDAIAISGAFDTVFVHATGIPYAETVAIQSRITLLGDSAAYLANGRDAARLPVISHDSGTAALLISGGLPVSVRFLAIQHAIDGPAIESRGVDVRLEHVHVNPGFGASVGSGILVVDAPAFAVVANSSIRAVRGYGVRLVNVAGARLSSVDVRNVTPLSGLSGAGIEINRGSGAIIDGALVRTTTGPQIQVDTAANATIISSDLAGRSQLVRLTGLTGTNTVSGTSFNLTRQPGDPFTLGSEFDGRSGLEIRLSRHVSVTGNMFFESQSDQMDAIRLIDARGSATGGATILANGFDGGRHHVRSLRSTWDMTGARSTGAVVPILAEGADTIALTSDTLENATGAKCLRSTGASSRLTITRTVMRGCTVLGVATGGPAVEVSGSGTVLIITDADLSGPDQTAVTFSGREIRVRGTRMSGFGERSVSGFTSTAALSVDATNAVEIVDNVMMGYSTAAGLLLANGDIRADSNRITRNATGIRILTWSTVQIRGNDISGNPLAGIRNDRSNRDLIAEGNWWGDARGPRRTSAATAAGDTAWGRVDFTPFATGPHAAGSTAAEVYVVRGNGQSGPANSTLPTALTVRIVDSDERPVAGVSVTFAVTSGGALLGGTSSRVVTTDASGLAESTLTLGPAGPTTISVSAAGVSAITLTATAQ